MSKVKQSSHGVMAANRKSYLDAMGLAAAGVTIVATEGTAGRTGATVSAMTSVSVEDESTHLLACLNATSATCAAVIENGAFSVNVLNAAQQCLADRFSGRQRVAGADKFLAGRWICGAAGQPVLDDALAVFECRLVKRMRVGSHIILVGRVIHIRADCSRAPLIYANRDYGRVMRLAA
jgi:flavin reductase